MTTKLEEALAQAKRLGFTVSPAITKQSSHKLTTEQRIAQLELENSVLRANAPKPQRTSLVESSHNTHTSNGYQSRSQRNRNALNERVNSLDWAQLADREQALPENVSAEQLLKDFSLLYLMKTGHFQGDD